MPSLSAKETFSVTEPKILGILKVRFSRKYNIQQTIQDSEASSVDVISIYNKSRYIQINRLYFISYFRKTTWTPSIYTMNKSWSSIHMLFTSALWTPGTLCELHIYCKPIQEEPANKLSNCRYSSHHLITYFAPNQKCVIILWVMNIL